jgi:hypothetical protein
MGQFSTETRCSPPKVIGLVAGWGRYPLVIADRLRDRGHRVIGIGIRDHADPQLRDKCISYREVGLGKIGTAIRFMARHGVQQATMAGKIHKVVLFQSFFWWKHFPDAECFRTFFPHFVTNARDRKDDTLLGAVVDAFARHNIVFQPPTQYLPELLVKSGVLTNRRPTGAEAKDIDFGWKVAKEMGRLDIGQSVAVKGRVVLAIEAIEGTDLCIARAGQLCSAGGFTVVKVAKPQQDMRFDVPTIGMGTMHSIQSAGGCVLAVEAEKTILVDEPEVFDFANRYGISIVAVEAGQCSGIVHEAA